MWHCFSEIGLAISKKQKGSLGYTSTCHVVIYCRDRKRWRLVTRRGMRLWRCHIFRVQIGNAFNRSTLEVREMNRNFHSSSRRNALMSGFEVPTAVVISITPCRLVRVQIAFRRNIWLTSSGSRSKPQKQAEFASCLCCLLFLTWR